MKTAKTVKEVLVATRYIQSKLGWCQEAIYKGYTNNSKDYANTATSCCLAGALNLVECSDSLIVQTAAIIAAKTDNDIGEWNDRPRRTKEQVIALLDKLIKAQP